MLGALRACTENVTDEKTMWFGTERVRPRHKHTAWLKARLRLVKRWRDFLPKAEVESLPRGLRGIYVLYKRNRSGAYNVVYVGMSAAGNRGHVRRRLESHRRSKGRLWTHCSVFEVWENIRDEEIRELEGLFRQIYSKDSRANKLNVQRGFKKLRSVPKIE